MTEHEFRQLMLKQERVASPTAPTPPNTPAGYSDEVVRRCVALAKRMTAPGWDASDVDWVAPILAEARAIVALIEPVDPDEQYARDLIREQGWQDEREIGSEAVVRMIAMARRALAAEGRHIHPCGFCGVVQCNVDCDQAKAEGYNPTHRSKGK